MLGRGCSGRQAHRNERACERERGARAVGAQGRAARAQQGRGRGAAEAGARGRGAVEASGALGACAAGAR